MPVLVFSEVTEAQHAQDAEKLKNTILHLDSLFWKAYNTCDVKQMETFFTHDLEFYHDKEGLTTSKKKLFESIRSGLCGNPDWWLRRKAVDGSLEVYPLKNYGAILSGEHVFYINETGKKERLDGLAKFTHVWLLTEDGWKMHRILSYDHRPAPKTME
jgi:hypothetical protein